MPRGATLSENLLWSAPPAWTFDDEAENMPRAYRIEIARPGPSNCYDSSEGDPIPQVRSRVGGMNLICHETLTTRGPSGDIGPLPDFDFLTCDRDPGMYAQYITQAFGFFRRHAEGRYSDKTLMRLARAADMVIEGESALLPYLMVAQVPGSFDELTEVKTGGTVAMAALWPHMDERLILCTSRNTRRKGYGSAVFRGVRYFSSTPHTWVGQNNVVGQQFLAKHGLYPTLIAPSGAIRYGTTAIDSDEEANDMRVDFSEAVSVGY